MGCVEDHLILLRLRAGPFCGDADFGQVHFVVTLRMSVALPGSQLP
jgi:hypothetical protein